ncbi:MAG: AMP-binding protein [Acidimicrobiia bacterium]|nr:AMP-binding protein [Acidimicrobiia bacterium]
MSIESPGWAAHLPEGVVGDSEHLLVQETLPAAWGRRWAQDPRRATLYTGDHGWVSAGELDRLSRHWAGFLRAHGVAPGERVLLSGANSLELVAAHVGALRVGAVVVPANTGYVRGELAHIVADARPRMALVDDVARVDGLTHDEGAMTVVPLTASAAHDAGAASEGEHDLDQVQRHDPALIAYTSGTTGRPKGAVLSHGNLLAGAEAMRLAWRWEPSDRLVLALPLFHIHGLGAGLHGTLLTGASLVLLPGFDVDTMLNAVSAHEATLFFGVPTMYARLARSPRLAELKALRLCVSGSAPLPAELMDLIERGSGQRILERYGMTETLMNISNPYDGERRAGTVGLPLPGVEVKLSPESEILLRGPNVFAGYWRNASATEASFVDGWFRSGDVGELDSAGYYRIVGRAKELIISGGYNVYPREVEEAILDVPGVVEAAVAGVPDPEWGEVVTAYVVRADSTVTAELIAAHCRQQLAPYKQPRRFVWRDQLPRNALGKVQRDRLSGSETEAAAPPPTVP